MVHVQATILSQLEEVGIHYLSTFLFKSSTSCYPQRGAREVLVSWWLSEVGLEP